MVGGKASHIGLYGGDIGPSGLLDPVLRHSQERRREINDINVFQTADCCSQVGEIPPRATTHVEPDPAVGNR